MSYSIKKYLINHEHCVRILYMAIYNLSNLSPYDFEILSKDLLEKHLNVSLENFKSGRDQGIDLRYKSSDEKLIIQCKHYQNSKFSDLKSSINKEKSKMIDVNPTRYILITSLGLTPANKTEIFKLMSPYIKNESDIFDSESICSMLRKYPEIEKTHYKLWLTSTHVLEKIFNSNIANKSDFKKDEIIRKIKLYVESNNFVSALKMLQENNYCIISGNPGIGKTTLAEILAYKLIDRGFDFINITSIEEAFKVLKDNILQVFYYDDFLGSNSFVDKLEANELLLFIDHIKKSKNKKLIMTTREYIFKQAKNNNEIINRINLEKCILRQSNYHKVSRAKILYNHLYFSDIDETHYSEILKNKKYLHIINHRNYSPRIIEWMTNSFQNKSIRKGSYYDEFIRNLENPKEIWTFAFEKNISELSQGILVTLFFINEEIKYDHLKKIVSSMYKEVPLITFSNNFKDSLKELENTFIKIMPFSGNNIVDFQNPSIKDFLNNYINSNIDILEDFYSMDSFFWDQKIAFLRSYIAKKESEKDKIYDLTINKSNILIRELIDNFKQSTIVISGKGYNITYRYKNHYDKIILLLNLINHYKEYIDYTDLIEDTVSVFTKYFQKDSFIRHKAYKIIDSLPNTVINEIHIKKLKSLYKDVEDIFELADLIEISVKYPFIDYEAPDIIDKLDETFDQIDIDLDEVRDLEEISETIELICNYFDVEFPYIFDKIEEKILEIEKKNEEAYELYIDNQIDSYKEQRFENSIVINEENEIDRIFDSLP